MPQHELLIANEVLTVDGLHEWTLLVRTALFELLSIEPLLYPLDRELALIKLSVVGSGAGRLQRLLMLRLADVGWLLGHLVDDNLRAGADVRWVLLFTRAWLVACLVADSRL